MKVYYLNIESGKYMQRLIITYPISISSIFLRQTILHSRDMNKESKFLCEFLSAIEL